MKYNNKNRNIEVAHTFTDWHAGRYHLNVSKRVYHLVTMLFTKTVLSSFPRQNKDPVLRGQ